MNRNNYRYDNGICIDGENLYFQSDFGEVSIRYLNRIKETIDYSLNQYPRTCIMRFDLRYPYDYSVDKVNSNQITKFQESLKAMITADLKRRNIKRHSFTRFIWCKEIYSSDVPHYHMAILVNGDVFKGIGPYANDERKYMSGKIIRAWASAIGVLPCRTTHVIHYPTNAVYVINKRKGEEFFNEQYKSVFYRLSYFAKLKTKDYGNKKKNFGSSRK